MRRYRNLAFTLLLALLVAAPGCSKKEKEEETGPSVEQIEAKAQQMDAEQLMANAQKCKEQILAMRVEVQQFVTKLKDLTPAEKAAGEAQRINLELDKLQVSMAALKTQLMVYYNKLMEKGVDVSELER